MGHMMRRMFTPGQGATLASFTAAVANGAMYPADWVMMSTTAPTAQGVTAGQHRGKTLGTYDYIECELAIVTAKLGCGSLLLGVLMGKDIGSVSNWANVASQVLADGDVAIIQNSGIHPSARQATAGLLGDYLTISGVAGEMLNGVSAGLTGDLNPPGVALTTSVTYTRDVTEDASPVFISRLGG